MKLILYSTPNCCLCEGLLEKLHQVKDVEFELEVRDITSNLNWFEKYQYEVPVLCLLQEAQQPPQELELPRISPRSPVTALTKLLRTLA